MNMLRSRTAIMGTIAVILSVLCQSTSFAAAPLVKTQAPGYYRMMLGDFEVTAISDGTAMLPADKLLHEPPEKTNKALQKSFLSTPVETSFTSYLINTGDKLILIDTGAGALFGPTLGKLAANLKASGYQPEQIDEIYITHMHPDHIGGLGTSTSVFPNAIVRADKHDADFWLSKDNMEKAPAEQKDFFKGALSTIGQYAQANKLKTFDGDTQLQPGIKAVANYGHTPGHTTYVVESKGQKLVLLGDLVHVAAVQFENPAVTIAFDSDAKAAQARRQAVFADAAKQGYLIGASHIQFPGLGHIRSSGIAYEFIPTNYEIPR